MSDYLCQGDASRDQRTGFSKTYLVTDGANLVGYFTVLADAIRLEGKEKPDGLRYGSAPALKLGRMGVCQPYQKQGIGNWILHYVVGLARKLSKEVGVRYVTLDALPRPKLIGMYETYGFVRNVGEEKRQKWWRFATRKIGKDKDLDHVSMRFDILLEEEVPAAAAG